MHVTFFAYPIAHGLLSEREQSMLLAWNDGVLTLEPGATHFGYVVQGECEVSTRQATYRLAPGMYFSLPGGGRVGGPGKGIVASQRDYLGFFQLGGPIERQGRLRYIDGCSDSLLVAPVVQGDPCLNLLYIPPGTAQTAHTHPSERLGVVVSGRGSCRTPQGEVPLSPGLAWRIPAGGVHSFHTRDDELRIIAWHPDSDFGPSHGDHPMLNRTLIQGVSAGKLAESPEGRSP